MKPFNTCPPLHGDRTRLITKSVRLLTMGMLIFFSVFAFAQQAARFDPQFELPDTAETVVLSYSEQPDLIANPDPIPLIRIYADGLVLIHYPRYMKRAGDYELHLDHGELMQLLHGTAQIIDVDTRSVKSAKRDARAAQVAATGLVTHRSDEVLEVFEINLSSFSANRSQASRAINQRIKWRDIRADADTYPSVLELLQLDQARSNVRALLENPDLYHLTQPVTAITHPGR